MSSLSRRNFLYAGGAAAAGAAASTTVGGIPSAAAASGAAPVAAAGSVAGMEEVLVPEGEDHLVVYVPNTGVGEVMVMTDGHEVTFHDPQLVARVQRAAKRARA